MLGIFRKEMWLLGFFAGLRLLPAFAVEASGWQSPPTVYVSEWSSNEYNHVEMLKFLGCTQAPSAAQFSICVGKSKAGKRLICPSKTPGTCPNASTCEALMQTYRSPEQAQVNTEKYSSSSRQRYYNCSNKKPVTFNYSKFLGDNQELTWRDPDYPDAVCQPSLCLYPDLRCMDKRALDKGRSVENEKEVVLGNALCLTPDPTLCSSPTYCSNLGSLKKFTGTIKTMPEISTISPGAAGAKKAK